MRSLKLKRKQTSETQDSLKGTSTADDPYCNPQSKNVIKLKRRQTEKTSVDRNQLIQNLLYLKQKNDEPQVDFESKVASSRDLSFIDNLIKGNQQEKASKTRGIRLRNKNNYSALEKNQGARQDSLGKGSNAFAPIKAVPMSLVNIRVAQRNQHKGQQEEPVIGKSNYTDFLEQENLKSPHVPEQKEQLSDWDDDDSDQNKENGSCERLASSKTQLSVFKRITSDSYFSAKMGQKKQLPA